MQEIIESVARSGVAERIALLPGKQCCFICVLREPSFVGALGDPEQYYDAGETRMTLSHV